MDETKKPAKNRFSEQLPTHAPDPGSWQRLSAKLDMLDAESGFREKLVNLPVHQPDAGTWNAILFRLNRAAYIKTGVRIALSAAAVLLLFFTISRFADTTQNTLQAPKLANQGKTAITPGNSSQNEILQQNQGQDSGDQTQTSGTKVAANALAAKTTTPDFAEVEPSAVKPETEIALNQNISFVEFDTTYSLSQELAFQETVLPTEEIVSVEIASDISVMQQQQQQQQPVNTTVTPPVKYYTPKDPQDAKSNNHFGLGMYYLPENIDNGDGNSVFHNVNLTASYNKEKVRYNTSLGMAYNEEQLVFEMNYDINTPVLAAGADGQLDTLGYRVDKMESQYQGTEKHQYFTYNLGLGRKLFSAGKFSTWISAGAGFGIRLNDPDIIASTEKSIKGQYNAQITSVQASQPEYNDVYVNFATGVDFNYRFLKRLSFTFTPTSLWYFKPVLTKDNQPTDELTLGFKTGMKFDF
jgi:hypothetical protein